MTTNPENTERPREESVAKVAELIAETKVCMFTTVDANGRMVSRPMGVLEVKFDGDLWFVSRDNARKVEQLRNRAKVNVAFASSHAWVSVAGEANIIKDVEKTKELWNPGLTGWFPEGPEDPGIVLVKVRADSAEYWDTPGTITASLLSFVKAHATGEPYKVDNKTVTL